MLLLEISKPNELESRDVIDDVSNRWALGMHFSVGSLLDKNPLNRLVYKISSIKVADTQTEGHTVTSTRRLTIRVG